MRRRVRARRQLLRPRVPPDAGATRAFYVHALPRPEPCRTTTRANDFNFATIYSDNAFIGNDRISDSNLLTVGMTTRLLDPDTGAEAARFGIAQRIRVQGPAR